MAKPDQLLQKAVRLHRAGRSGEAGQCCDELLRTAPAHAGALNLRGIIAAQGGDLAAAIRFFQRAVEAAPADAGALENLGRAQLGRGDFAGAEQSCRRALAIRPGSVVARFGLGVACHNLGRLEEARSCFEQVLDAAPAMQEARAFLGQVFFQQGEHARAAALFRAALDAGFERVDVLSGYAQALEQQGDEAGAREYYFRAVERDPASQAAYILLDQFLLKSGGPAKQALLDELASDHVYRDWDESMQDFRRLAALYDYPDTGARRALHRFMEEYDPGELHDQAWWRRHLQAFGGPGNTHDRLLRSIHSAVYCWSLPDAQTLEGIAAFVGDARLCSYGAGSGVWERLLQQHFGVEVSASDIRLRHRFLDMQQADYASARVEAEDCIFLAWILRGDDRVLNLLRQLRPGQKLVLVGEPRDALGIPRICASPAVWTFLDTAFRCEREIPLAAYSLFHDTVSLFVRK